MRTNALRIAAKLANADRRQGVIASGKLMREYIASATAEGYLDQLYYYILMRVPNRYRKGWQDDGLTPASWPLNWIPVVPLAPYPELAELAADLLRTSFLRGNPSDHEFIVQLTTLNQLHETSARWYIYGEEEQVEIDHICPQCGMVQPGPFYEPPDCTCAAPNGLKRFGLVRTVSAYVMDETGGRLVRLSYDGVRLHYEKEQNVDGHPAESAG